MIKLLKNANVYAPEPLGKKDILIEGEKILRMDDCISGYDGLPDVEVYDLEGKTLVPGYIDLHVHITGGGGEQGPTSRVPESQLSVFLVNGITTVVGLLGTDGVTRSVENLVAKARALTEEGMTAYTLTSAYGYPPTTITGSVEKDIMMIPPMIGVKVAVSDHRSSNPTGEELVRLATAARRAGLLSCTPGLVTMHMGSGKGGLDPIFYVLDNSDVPVKNLLPTHMLRTPELIDQGAELVRRGGYMDCTAGGDDEELETEAEKLMELLSRDGVTADHVTLSSDAYGSQPRFNENGECIGLTYASPKYLHRTIQSLVGRGMALEEALKLLTSTPAVLLGQEGRKGCVAEGADADLLILGDGLEIDSLIARGQRALWKGELLMKGRFE
ncbi:beta-aspartyl-peptidase [Clostridium sp. AN503]|uniref:beta-aspartyl-peptidase n=1 Tax=Clostridium sp. AN503 TaxID=3160598 RepID=UPI00345980D4